MGEICEKALSYGKEKDDGTLRRSEEILAKIERGGMYVLCDGLTTTMNEMAQIADIDVCRGSKASFESGLVEIFKLRTIKMFWA